MAKERDYKREYQRRIANAKKRGLTLSQARGHPRPGEKPIRRKPKSNDPLLDKALRFMREAGTQKAAAKRAGVSAERLRRYIYDNGLAKRKGRQWLFTDNRQRLMESYVAGRAVTLRLPNFDEASFNGKFMDAVGKFLNSGGKYHFIEPFVGQSVRDTKGKRHFFETDRNELFRLASGDEPFEQIYRFIN